MEVVVALRARHHVLVEVVVEAARKAAGAAI
jgi:hypothetical protein